MFDVILTVPMNDLSRGIERDRSLLQSVVDSVFDSGHVVMGPQHDAFQVELARYLGVTSAVGVASGTDALELAIKAAMPAGRGTVLTAANAGGYSSIAARRAGYHVRYADVDKDTLCVNEDTITRGLADDVGVVVVTHLYGHLTDIRQLVEVCHSRGVRVVEDCAQAIGARRDSQAAGSFGDLGAISFYPTKNLGALGDGGAIVTNDQEFAARVAQLRQYGWESKYRVTVPGGVNSRLDELQAGFLRAKLPSLDLVNDRRRAIIQRYAEAAAGGPMTILPADGEHHVGHLAVARMADRSRGRAELSKRGVATDVHFPVLDYQQPGLKGDECFLPVSEKATEEVFSLPCFAELTDDEIEFVCDAIRSLAS